MGVPMTFTEAESSPGSGPVYVPGKLSVPFLETRDVGRECQSQVEGQPRGRDAGAQQVGKDTCLSEGDSGPIPRFEGPAVSDGPVFLLAGLTLIQPVILLIKDGL